MHVILYDDPGKYNFKKKHSKKHVIKDLSECVITPKIKQHKFIDKLREKYFVAHVRVINRDISQQNRITK